MDVSTVKECGNFLNFIQECVMSQMSARFLCAGTDGAFVIKCTIGIITFSRSRLLFVIDDQSISSCRHFKEKVKQQSKKDEVKWKVLVSKVHAAKRVVNAFSLVATV